MYTVSSRY